MSVPNALESGTGSYLFGLATYRPLTPRGGYGRMSLEMRILAVGVMSGSPKH
jgi:hypothetical protein